MKKNILLTGGSGFLGNLLLKKYKNEFNFICVGKNEQKLQQKYERIVNGTIKLRSSW